MCSNFPYRKVKRMLDTNWICWIGPLTDVKASPQVTEREHVEAKEQGIYILRG